MQIKYTEHMADQVYASHCHSFRGSRVQPKYRQRKEHDRYSRCNIRGVHYTMMSAYDELVNDHRVAIVRTAFIFL